jgi:hypothetical protein
MGKLLRQLLLVLAPVAIVFVGVGAYVNVVRAPKVTGVFAPDQLRGVSIWHEGLEYPLNFNQTAELVAILRHAHAAPSSDGAITLYRFDADPIHIDPAVVADDRLQELISECHD